jgi:hypothetical protein
MMKSVATLVAALGLASATPEMNILPNGDTKVRALPV